MNQSPMVNNILRFCCLFMILQSYNFINYNDDTNDRRLSVAKKVIDQINNQDGTSLRKLFSPEFRTRTNDPLVAVLARGIHQKRGRITGITIESYQFNSARFNLTTERGGGWLLELVYEEGDSIGGINFLDQIPKIAVPPRNITPMRLPFEGTWRVISGGATPAENFHLIDRNGLDDHAIDFDKMDSNGKARTGNGTSNDHYIAYSQNILAAADGEVTTVIDGVPDNRPSYINSMTGIGNAIVLKHSDREFTLYGHLLAGSSHLKVGQRVKSGETIGKCGNSGRSFGPHLHFALLNAGHGQEAVSYPVFFSKVRIDPVSSDAARVLKRDYAPVKGDRLTHQN